MKLKLKQIKDNLNLVSKKVTNFLDHLSDFLINLFDKHHFWIMLIFVSVISIFIRIVFIPLVSGDSYWYLEPWVRFIRDNGGLSSLGQIPISYYRTAVKDYPYGTNFTSPVISIVYGNYPVFYYFLLAVFSYLPISELAVIKIISYIFDFAMAFALLKTLSLLTKNKVLLIIIFTLGLSLPTFIINSSIWGQIDVIYGGMALWAVYFLIKEKPKTAMVFIGIALSVKLQIVFILPIIGWLFLKRKFRLLHLLIVPLIVFISYMPSYIAGMSFMQPINHHIALSNTYSSITLNAGSIYAFLYGINGKLSPLISDFAIGLTLLTSIVIIYYLFKERIVVNAKSIILVGTIFSLIVPYLLPHMHERYFYMAEAFILVYAFTQKNRWHLVVLMQLSTLISYAYFILGGWFFPTLGSNNIILSASINAFIIVQLLLDTKLLERDQIMTPNEGDKKLYS